MYRVLDSLLEIKYNSEQSIATFEKAFLILKS